MKIKFLLILIFALVYSGIKAQSVEVNISNIKNTNGKLLVALYNTEDGFLKDAYKSRVLDITSKEAQVIFDTIPAGIYTVGVVHDENGNLKLETNFIGIPKEPVAISNNAPSEYGPPKYKDAKFNVYDGKRTIQNIRFD